MISKILDLAISIMCFMECNVNLIYSVLTFSLSLSLLISFYNPFIFFRYAFKFLYIENRKMNILPVEQSQNSQVKKKIPIPRSRTYHIPLCARTVTHQHSMRFNCTSLHYFSNFKFYTLISNPIRCINTTTAFPPPYPNRKQIILKS